MSPDILAIMIGDLKEQGADAKHSDRHMADVKINLEAEPDGYGFLYGDALVNDGAHHSINGLPPKRYWKGQIELEGQEPHEPTGCYSSMARKWHGYKRLTALKRCLQRR